MADTNKGRKFFVSVDVAGDSLPMPAPADLTQAEFEALKWTEVKNVGSIGETGTDTNIVSYDELATEVTQKQKGISNAGDPEIECARNATDPGQITMRLIGSGFDKSFYAFKIEDADKPAGALSTPTIYYMRGLATGPKRPNGRNEDFNLEVYTLGLTQLEIVVNAVQIP